jgi:hypothetical protein
MSTTYTSAHSAKIDLREWARELIEKCGPFPGVRQLDLSEKEDENASEIYAKEHSITIPLSN